MALPMAIAKCFLQATITSVRKTFFTMSLGTLDNLLLSNLYFIPVLQSQCPEYASHAGIAVVAKLITARETAAV